MRLRLPELLKEHPTWTRYSLAKELHARAGVSMSTFYRIVRKRGELANFDAEMLAALADILEVTADGLLEPTKSRKGKRG